MYIYRQNLLSIYFQEFLASVLKSNKKKLKTFWNKYKCLNQIDTFLPFFFFWQICSYNFYIITSLLVLFLFYDKFVLTIFTKWQLCPYNFNNMTSLLLQLNQNFQIPYLYKGIIKTTIFQIDLFQTNKSCQIGSQRI